MRNISYDGDPRVYTLAGESTSVYRHVLGIGSKMVPCIEATLCVAARALIAEGFVPSPLLLNPRDNQPTARIKEANKLQ